MSTQRARKTYVGTGAFARPAKRSEAHDCATAMSESAAAFSCAGAAENVSKWANSPCQAGFGGPCRNLQTSLDFPPKRISIELSPPIQFRIEWADSQGMSPLLGCRPI